MQVPSIPKGTRDFYPELMSERNYIFDSWKESCRRFGFEEIDAPVFEHITLYTEKSGDEIEGQLYSFFDKGNRKLALRPEMTPSLARMVAAKGSSLKKPVRWFSIPRLFRYEKMQKGRLREFFQLNMDILGIKEISADAELIAGAASSLSDLGLTSNDFSIHISSRNLLDELFKSEGIKEESLSGLYALLDKMDKMPEDVFQKEFTRCIPDSGKREAVLDILNSESIQEIQERFPEAKPIKELIELFGLLEEYGLSEYVEFNPGIVRGLAYYTGIVFEIYDTGRKNRAIAGGGRYDRLVSKYGGPDTPAVGFAAGDVVLSNLLKEKGLLETTHRRSDVFVLSLDRSSYRSAVECASMLRRNGISCEYSLRLNSIGKQIKNADAANSKVVVFTGGEEEENLSTRIKDMDTGNEETVKKSGLAERISEILKSES